LLESKRTKCFINY